VDIVRQSLHEYLLQGISDALDEGVRAWQALKAGIAIDRVVFGSVKASITGMTQIGGSGSSRLHDRSVSYRPTESYSEPRQASDVVSVLVGGVSGQNSLPQLTPPTTRTKLHSHPNT
jgi:hypothetical protein